MIDSFISTSLTRRRHEVYLFYITFLLGIGVRLMGIVQHYLLFIAFFKES